MSLKAIRKGFVRTFFLALLGLSATYATAQQSGGQDPVQIGGGIGDLAPTLCANQPCGFPDFNFTQSCNAIAPSSVASELFRYVGRDCFLPEGTTQPLTREHYAFQRCSFDELKALIDAGDVVPDANGNVVVTIAAGDVLRGSCPSQGAPSFQVPNAWMIEMDETGFLDGLYSQGNSFPFCNAPLPIKPYLKLFNPNGSSFCLPMAGVSAAAGNPFLPNFSTIVETPFFFYINPPPPQPPTCEKFEFLIEFNYQCMQSIVARWDWMLGGDFGPGETLFDFKVLTCGPCTGNHHNFSPYSHTQKDI